MPAALLPTLPQWVDAVCRVLESAAQRPLTASPQLPAARAAKRALQICLALVTRHRPHVRPATPLPAGSIPTVGGRAARADRAKGVRTNPNLPCGRLARAWRACAQRRG